MELYASKWRAFPSVTGYSHHKPNFYRRNPFLYRLWGWSYKFGAGRTSMRYSITSWEGTTRLSWREDGYVLNETRLLPGKDCPTTMPKRRGGNFASATLYWGVFLSVKEPGVRTMCLGKDDRIVQRKATTWNIQNWRPGWKDNLIHVIECASIIDKQGT